MFFSLKITYYATYNFNTKSVKYEIINLKNNILLFFVDIKGGNVFLTFSL